MKKTNTLTGTFVVWALLIWIGGQKGVINSDAKMMQIEAHVCKKGFTLTDLGCQVLQESVVQQLGKIVQNEREARFGVVLTHHVIQLLPVGLAPRVVLHTQTTHL